MFENWQPWWDVAFIGSIFVAWLVVLGVKARRKADK